MAQMIAKPQSTSQWDAALVRAGRVSRAARAFVDRFGWRLLLWRLAWAPWWLFANRPAPDLPARVEAPRDLDAPGHYVVHTLDRLRRKVQIAWLFACLVRGLTLGVIVAIAWVLVADVAGAVRPSLRAVLILSGLLAICGGAFATLSRPSRTRLAHMLDRTYLLDERLATAVESLERPTASSFANRIGMVQRADAANQLAVLHPDVTRGSFIPWREVGALLTMLALLLALGFAGLRAPRVPAAESGVIPAFVPASDRLASQPQNQAAPATGPIPRIDQSAGNALLGDLNQLGNALDKNPSTQPAAKAIQAGNYPQAASSLQSSSANADKMSPDERNALANQLDRSADQMSGQSPDLQNSTQQAANGLRQGGQQAQQGMSNLANSVDKAAGQTSSQTQAGQSAAQPSDGAPAANDQQGQQSGQQGAAQQQQNGQGQSGSQSAQQQGSGSKAQPGTSQEGQNGAQNSGQQSGSQTSPNQDAQQGGAQAQQGAAGQPGSQNQAQGQDANGQSAASSSGGSQTQGGAPPDQGRNEQTSNGAGAGAGKAAQAQGSSGKQAPGQQSQTQTNSTPPKGTAAKPPANGGAASGNDQKGTKGAGGESVALSGSSDQMVQAGNDPSSSSQGTGANAGAAQGNAQQGTVGAAGPDTNRVPAGYRGVVSAYFDDTQP